MLPTVTRLKTLTFIAGFPVMLSLTIAFCISPLELAFAQPVGQKLTASDPSAVGQFGYSVAVEGDTALIGSPANVGNGYQQAIYDFRRDADGNWQEFAKLLPAKLLPADPEPITYGTFLVRAGDQAVTVSLHTDDRLWIHVLALVEDPENPGPKVWKLQEMLYPLNTDGELQPSGDNFRFTSLDFDGTTIIAGASGYSTSTLFGIGAVYIFEYSDETKEFDQKQILLENPAVQFNRFGISVAVDDDTALIGAQPLSNPGFVTEFIRNDNGLWAQRERLAEPVWDPPLGAGSAFGANIALDGNHAVVSARVVVGEPGMQVLQDTLFPYHRDPGEPGDPWVGEIVLPDVGGRLFGLAGSPVALRNETLLARSTLPPDPENDFFGKVAVFARDTCDELPAECWKLTESLYPVDAEPGDNGFGFAIDFDGRTALVGMPFDYDAMNQLASAGSVSAYSSILSSDEPPHADAGPDQTAHFMDTVILDGTTSFDDNTATEDLIASWEILSAPEGSTTTILDPNVLTAAIVIDALGEYKIQLTVTDQAGLASVPDTMLISSENIAPTANSGDDQVVFLGSLVTLDGSASFDPDGDDIVYSWTILSPSGNEGFLYGVSPSFDAGELGVYQVKLIVDDTFAPSEPDFAEVVVANASDSAQVLVETADGFAAGLDSTQVTTSGNQRALTNFFGQAIRSIQMGNIADAIVKLQNALVRTDGCIERGAPDDGGDESQRDWIVDCGAQFLVYPEISNATAALEAL